MKIKSKIALYVFALVVPLAVIGLANRPASVPQPMTKEQQVKQEGYEHVVLGLNLLLDSLRNPDSLQLESATAMPNGAACFEYRAQNGFGGFSKETAVLTPEKWDGKTLPGPNTLLPSAHAWNRWCAEQAGDEYASDALVRQSRLLVRAK